MIRNLLIKKFQLVWCVLWIGIFCLIACDQKDLRKDQSFEPRSVAEKIGHPSLSADGTRAVVEKESGLAILDLKTGETQSFPISVSNGARPQNPDWSHDGERIAFDMEVEGSRNIWMTNIDGTNPTRLTNDSSLDISPDWSPDGNQIVFQSQRDNENQSWGLWVLSTKDKTVHRISPEGESVEDGVWSPDGRWIAYATSGRGYWQSTFYIVSPVDGSRRTILGASNLLGARMRYSWSPDGNLLAFVANNNIWVIPSVDGQPTLVTENEDRKEDPVWSVDGKSLFFTVDQGLSQLFVKSIESSQPKLLDQHQADYQTIRSIAWSPDGKFIAFPSLRNGNSDIWSISVGGANLKQITKHQAFDSNPLWSPNGLRLAFQSNRSGNNDIWTILASGDRPAQVTIDSYSDNPSAWSVDGKYLAFNSDRWFAKRGIGNVSIWMIPASGGRPEELVRANMQDIQVPRNALWSPDRKKMAFTAHGLGRTGIWILDMETRDISQPILSSYGPVWSPDGQYLAFYTTQDDPNKEGKVVLQMLSIQGNSVKKLTDPFSPVTNIIWSSNNNRLIYGDLEKGILSISIAGKEVHLGGFETPEYTSSVVLSPNGKMVAYTADVGTYSLWAVTAADYIQSALSKKARNLASTDFVLEAEDADEIKLEFQRELDKNASNGAYISTPDTPGESKYRTGKATHTVMISQAGDYKILGRVIAPKGESDSFLISVDDEEQHIWDLSHCSVWSWRVGRRRPSLSNPDSDLTFQLSAGEHKIHIGVREDGTKLDQLVLYRTTSEQKIVVPPQ